MGVVNFTPWPPYPWGKNPQYSLERRLSQPQNESECGGEKKKSLPLPGIELRSSSP